MRSWVEVYNQSGTKVAYIEALISGTTTTVMDAAGTFDLSFPVDEKVVDFLIRDNEVAIYQQEDTELPVLAMRGKIIKPNVQETGDSISIKIAGRDLMEELRWRTIGLGLIYNAQTVQAIMSDLAAKVPGWTAAVDSANMARLQTARFDGSQVLKAMLKSADQLGLHVRNGTATRTLEIGAFGTSATTANGEKIRAIKAPSNINVELYNNDAVLLVDSVSMAEDGDTLVNWAIPMGAGTGSTATTLKNTTYRILNTDNTIYRAGTIPYYPIYRRVNAANIEEYYIDASAGATQHQDTLSFKEIGPIANSVLAQQLAADALAIACIESLKRSSVALKSYTLTVRKLRTAIRPGDLIRLTYRGTVANGNNPKGTRPELVYIDVDQDMWVMSVQRNISDSGMTYTLQVNTIDKHLQDDLDILVEVLDRTEVQNLSIQTFPFGFQDSSERAIQGNAAATTPYRDATFGLQVPDIFTDVISAKLHIITRPSYTTADVGPVLAAPSALDYSFRGYESPNYPSDISLYIDGVNVTSALGGPWNPSAGNSAVDVTVDITNYISQAAGGLYQNHSLVFKALAKTAETRVSTSHNSTVESSASNGFIEAKILFLGMARAIL